MNQDIFQDAIRSATSAPAKIEDELSEKVARRACLALMRKAKTCLLATLDIKGSIQLRAMLNLKHRGLHNIWFSTNSSSAKIAQIKQNPQAVVYYYDEKHYQGLRLTGNMELLQDHRSRVMLWSQGAELYYPLGVDDPDYTVLKFTAETANFYHNLHNINFKI